MGTTRRSEPPIRTCVGCRERRPQHELRRCVLDPSGVARVDRHAPGRGAWVCGADCAALAARRGGFARAWRTTVPDGALDGLVAQLSR